MVVDLLLRFEDAVCDISYLRTDGMSDDGLNAITAEASAGCDCTRQIDYLIAVMLDVRCYIVLESAFGLIAITYTEFHTHVIYGAGIHPLG